MTKEHKKLYKAGKNWIVATLTVAALTVLGGGSNASLDAHADTVNDGQQQKSVNSHRSQIH